MHTVLAFRIGSHRSTPTFVEVVGVHPIPGSKTITVLESDHVRDPKGLPRMLGFDRNLASLRVMQYLLHTMQTLDDIRSDKQLATRTDVQHRFGRRNRVSDQHHSGQ